MNRRRHLGGKARVEVGIEHRPAQEVDAVRLHRLRTAGHLGHLPSERVRGHPVPELRDLTGEVRRCGPADATRAERGEPFRHLLEIVERERVTALRVGDRVEEQPFDVARVRQRVGDRELGAVGGAPKRDLVDAQRLAYRVDVVGVIAGGVVGAAGADLRPALGCERLGSGARRERVGLELGAAENARFAGPAVVEGNQRVAGELIAPVDCVRAELEGAGRRLSRPACDEEQDAARLPRSGQLFDV